MMRVAAFLGDYVIELGPADIPQDLLRDLEAQSAQAPGTARGQAHQTSSL